jgi:SHS family lactate transporter-like MFS transporter
VAAAQRDNVVNGTRATFICLGNNSGHPGTQLLTDVVNEVTVHGRHPTTRSARLLRRSLFVVYYSIYALFATWLAAAVVATPILLSNLLGFVGMAFWGWLADLIGRRWSIIIPAVIAASSHPCNLLTNDVSWINGGFVAQGFFGGAINGQNPSYLTERFPTEVRSTASAFCYHQGAIFGGLVPPVISYLAIEHQLGFAIPMLIGTVAGSASVAIALLLSPETKGKVFVAELGKH